MSCSFKDPSGADQRVADRDMRCLYSADGTRLGVPQRAQREIPGANTRGRSLGAFIQVAAEQQIAHAHCNQPAMHERGNRRCRTMESIPAGAGSWCMMRQRRG